MSLQTRLSDLITAIGADIKSLTTLISAKPSGVSAILSATQTNSTVTPAVLTGHTFVVPAGKTLVLTGVLVWSAVATTGVGYGVRVTQPTGANANAIASWSTEIQQTSAVASTGTHEGGVLNVAANSNAYGESLGATSNGGGTPSAVLQTVVKNLSTNASTTVTIEFRSEVSTSPVVAQIGSGAGGIIV